MDFSFRIIDRRQLDGFRSYLSAATAAMIDSQCGDILAVGAVVGRNACGAAAARVRGDSAEVTDIFVDEQIRGSGAGSFLMDILLDTLLEMGMRQISISYVMSRDECQKLGSILKRRGFSEAAERSVIYKAKAAAFALAEDIEKSYGAAHRGEYKLCSFAELDEGMLAELEQAPTAVNLSWRELKAAAEPEISSALIRNGRVEQYFLCRQLYRPNGDIVILSANSRENALAGDFYFVFTDMMSRCRARVGSDDFNLCFSAYGKMIKRVVSKLPKELLTEYREMESELKA